MRRLYNEFFYIPKDGKIRDKVMLAHAVRSVAVILLCLAAMGFGAYANFADGMRRGVMPQELTAKITVVDKAAGTPIVLSKNKTELTDGKVYTVTVELDENNIAKTGFCVIDAGELTWHTAQIGADISADDHHTDKITFELKASSDTALCIDIATGTSALYGMQSEFYIKNGDIIEIK